MTASSPPPSLAAMGEQRFVSLTTFRRAGTPVSVPVWVAAHDGALVVTTTRTSGKVKRLRGDARVELRPCSRRGQVDPGAPVMSGRATIETRPEFIADAAGAIRDKYGWEYRLVMLVERVLRRGRRGERVILRITEPHSAATPG